MDTGIALNALRGSSVSASPRGLTAAQNNTFFTGSPLLPCKRINALGCQGLKKNRGVLLVEAKGKKGMAARLYQQRPPPTLPKAEDDNPRFLLFIRTKKFPRWYPVSIITGGTTAKLMVAAKNTPIGKGIYESTLTRNMAGVVYKIPPKDELKSVVDRVKDFFGNAASGVKESFGRISSLNNEAEEDAGTPDKEQKSKAGTTS